MAPSQPQPLAAPAPELEPPAETPAGPPGAISELQALLEGVVGARIDEAIAAGSRSIAASLGPALSSLAASIEDSVRTALRSELASFAAEQGRVVRELRASIAGLEQALEELKPHEDGPEPATAARLEEAIAQIRQQLGEVGPEVGRPLGELREVVLAKLAADGQVRDALASVSERLAALEDKGVLAVEEPLRELRREVAHDLRAVREQLAEEVSSEMAAVASAARTAVGEARFARSQLAQAVQAMEKVVASGDESAE